MIAAFSKNLRHFIYLLLNAHNHLLVACFLIDSFYSSIISKSHGAMDKDSFLTTFLFEINSMPSL
jgi:hypothetical protein